MNYFKYLSLLLILSFFPKTKTSQPPHTERTTVKKPKAILQTLSKALSCFMLLRSSLTQNKPIQPKKILVKSMEKAFPKDQWHHCQDDDPTDTNDSPTPIIEKSISLNQEKPYIKMTPSIEEVKTILKNEDLPECLYAIIIEMLGKNSFSKIILSSSLFNDFDKFYFDMRDLTEKFKEMLKQKKIIALSDLKKITTKDAKKIAGNFMFSFCLEDNEFDLYTGSDAEWSADKAMDYFFSLFFSYDDENEKEKMIFDYIPDINGKKRVNL